MEANGMATASLVCGILGCIPPCSLLAIIFGIIGLVCTGNPRVRGKRMAITGLVLGVVVLLLYIPMLIAIMLPALNQAREWTNRTKCASNLHQIYVGMLLYSNADPKQSYPPDLGTLYMNQDMTLQVFICPSGTTSIPSNISNGPKSQQQAQWINQNSDYVYLGKGKTDDAGVSTVLAYEPLGNHHKGM